MTFLFYFTRSAGSFQQYRTFDKFSNMTMKQTDSSSASSSSCTALAGSRNMATLNDTGSLQIHNGSLQNHNVMPIGTVYSKMLDSRDQAFKSTTC